MAKISSQQFHEMFEGMVGCPAEVVGYGEDSKKIYDRGYSDAMNAIYQRMVDTSLDHPNA